MSGCPRSGGEHESAAGKISIPAAWWRSVIVRHSRCAAGRCAVDGAGHSRTQWGTPGHDGITRGTRMAGKERDAGTRSAVLVALGANLVIAAAKTAAGVFAGSPALLSEAAHSVADSLDEVFLLPSLRRSRRTPDSDHPFGYGKERYFWSLLAAVGIFVLGGCFSFYQGLEALRG